MRSRWADPIGIDCTDAAPGKTRGPFSLRCEGPVSYTHLDVYKRQVLYRSILWSAHDEANLLKWYSDNFNVEVHAFVENGKFCVVNNTYESQSTTVYRGDGSAFTLCLEPNQIVWYEIE